MTRLVILFIGLYVLLSGCSYFSSLGSSKQEETATPQTQRGLMKPDSATHTNLAFDPMDLGPTVFAQNIGNDEGELLVPESEFESMSDAGYRIQLGAFIDQSLANKLASRAENELGDQTYVVFDRPFYRVRIGNFKDLNEAEAFKSNAISKGYQDARIARDKIELSSE